MIQLDLFKNNSFCIFKDGGSRCFGEIVDNSTINGVFYYHVRCVCLNTDERAYKIEKRNIISYHNTFKEAQTKYHYGEFNR